jgi:hypothetical protein
MNYAACRSGPPTVLSPTISEHPASRFTVASEISLFPRTPKHVERSQRTGKLLRMNKPPSSAVAQIDSFVPADSGVGLVQIRKSRWTGSSAIRPSSPMRRNVVSAKWHETARVHILF